MSDHTMFLDFGLFSINWYGLMMGVTVLLTAGLYVLLRRRQGENAENSLTTALIAMPAALVGARVFYCWFAKALFAGGVIEMMNLLTGGYALYGALLGILPVISARGLRGGKSLPAMLDAVCPPLSFAIAAEKWAGLINGSDIGFSVSAPWVQRFPFSLLSAADQTYYLWVGFFEGLTAAILCAALAAVFLTQYPQGRSGTRRGDVTLLFMMGYGFSQSFWESLRDDSLFMVTLGFVRINQIISIVMAAAALILLMVRRGRRKGVSAADIGLWTLCGAALALAVYCEFTMNAVSMTRNYILLAVSLSSMLTAGVLLLVESRRHTADERSSALPDRKRLGDTQSGQNTPTDPADGAADGFAPIDVDGLDLDELKSLR